MTGNDHDPDYTRIVADADVLAADLLVGGASRATLDILRAHSWLTPVATDRLLEDAEAVVAELTDESLAADWRERLDEWVVVVEQPEGDHPALAAAYRGNATQVVSLDQRLLGAKAAAALGGRIDVSVRPPDAFERLFDPESIYELVFEEPYPGPDSDPRS
ncbi:MAG: DUF7384 family protein [Natronomonas sp.]